MSGEVSSLNSSEDKFLSNSLVITIYCQIQFWLYTLEFWSICLLQDTVLVPKGYTQMAKTQSSPKELQSLEGDR